MKAWTAWMTRHAPACPDRLSLWPKPVEEALLTALNETKSPEFLIGQMPKSSTARTACHDDHRGLTSVAVGLAWTWLELQPSQGQSPMIDWVNFLSRADDFGSWASLAKALQTVTAGTRHSVLHIHCSLFDDGPLFWWVLWRPPWLAKPKICSTYPCCLPFRNGIYATNISSRSTTCISQ